MKNDARRSQCNHWAAKYGSKRKRMPYGGCTMIVGDVVETESQSHLILTVNEEVETGGELTEAT